MMVYIGSVFKKFSAIYDWLFQQLNKSREKLKINKVMTKGKTALIQKDSWKNYHSQYLQTNNIYIYDAANPNHINDITNIFLDRIARAISMKAKIMP